MLFVSEYITCNHRKSNQGQGDSQEGVSRDGSPIRVNSFVIPWSWYRGVKLTHDHDPCLFRGTQFGDKSHHDSDFDFSACKSTSLVINLPTAFWGLLGPRKDVTMDFIKTISKQVAIF